MIELKAKQSFINNKTIYRIENLALINDEEYNIFLSGLSLYTSLSITLYSFTTQYDAQDSGSTNIFYTVNGLEQILSQPGNWASAQIVNAPPQPPPEQFVLNINLNPAAQIIQGAGDIGEMFSQTYAMGMEKMRINFHNDTENNGIFNLIAIAYN